MNQLEIFKYALNRREVKKKVDQNAKTQLKKCVLCAIHLSLLYMKIVEQLQFSAIKCAQKKKRTQWI